MTGTGGSPLGTAGAGGGTTGAAGSTGGTAGAGGRRRRDAWDSWRWRRNDERRHGRRTTSGTAGTGGGVTGAAGTGAPAHSSGGGGCAVAHGRSTMAALASLLVAMTLAGAISRRRRRFG